MPPTHPVRRRIRQIPGASFRSGLPSRSVTTIPPPPHASATTAPTTPAIHRARPRDRPIPSAPAVGTAPPRVWAARSIRTASSTAIRRRSVAPATSRPPRRHRRLRHRTVTSLRPRLTTTSRRHPGATTQAALDSHHHPAVTTRETPADLRRHPGATTQAALDSHLRPQGMTTPAARVDLRPGTITPVGQASRRRPEATSRAARARLVRNHIRTFRHRRPARRRSRLRVRRL